MSDTVDRQIGDRPAAARPRVVSADLCAPPAKRFGVFPRSDADAGLRAIIRSLDDLEDRRRILLECRWLQQLRYFDREARVQHALYLATRGVATVIGVVVPTIVASRATIMGAPWETTVVVLTLAIALLLGIETFQQFGEQWRHFRRIAEWLRIEGWSFIELGGPTYARHRSHDAAWPDFVTASEALYFKDIEEFPWAGRTSGNAKGGAREEPAKAGDGEP